MPEKLEWDHGQHGMEVIESGDGDVSKKFFAVKAIGGTLTFGPNMSVSTGSAPREDDTLAQGDVLNLPFDTIDIKSGTAYAFYKARQ